MPVNQEKMLTETPPRVVTQEQSDSERPTTVNSPKPAGKTVRVVWPNNEFVVEGLPLMNREGTTVAAADVKKAQDMADLCGVELEVED